jgi:rRNA large subunit m3Psi methyltransferase RlmH
VLFVKLICCGKLKESFYKEACAEYEKRLSAFCRLEVCRLPEEGGLEKEAIRILEAIPQGAYTVAMCIEGKKLNSEALAQKLQEVQNGGVSKICFIIGSSEGMHQSVKNAADLRKKCGDRAVLRALHFFREDQRAVAQAEALNAGNFSLFLELMNQSGLSSSLLLQNTWSPSHPRRQSIPLALAVGRELLAETGAIRVHGGGFAGTIQAFVPFDRLDTFCSGMDGLFGEGSCHVLRIRPQGACVITG